MGSGLTEAQGLALDAHVAAWTAVALACEPADRESGEAAIAALYVAERYSVPRFEWVDSPAAAIESARALKLHRRDDVWPYVRKPHSWDNYPVSIDTLRSRTSWTFRNDVFQSQMLPADRVGINFWYRSRGDDLEHVARGLFVRDELGFTPKIDCLDQYAAVHRALWYWWPYKNVCIACERPEFVRVEDGKLHSTKGAAIRFRDGWEVWATNGNVHDGRGEAA